MYLRAGGVPTRHTQHTNGTAYTRGGTYSRVHTQTHTHTHKRTARPDKVRCGLTPWRRPYSTCRLGSRQKNFSYFGSAASRPGHAAEVAVVFPARRLRHGVVMPRTSCPRLTRESPHQLAVPHVSWRQPRTRNTTLGGRPTAARIHRTARVNMCIQISPMESPLVGHVTAGRAALETGCMPTPLQRDAGTIPS